MIVKATVEEPVKGSIIWSNPSKDMYSRYELSQFLKVNKLIVPPKEKWLRKIEKKDYSLYLRFYVWAQLDTGEYIREISQMALADYLIDKKIWSNKEPLYVNL